MREIRGQSEGGDRSGPADPNPRRSAGEFVAQLGGLRSVVSSTLSAALRSGSGQLALAGDAVFGGPVGRERMAAAGLVVAADQLAPEQSR